MILIRKRFLEDECIILIFFIAYMLFKYKIEPVYENEIDNELEETIVK